MAAWKRRHNSSQEAPIETGDLPGGGGFGRVRRAASLLGPFCVRRRDFLPSRSFITARTKEGSGERRASLPPSLQVGLSADGRGRAHTRALLRGPHTHTITNRFPACRLTCALIHEQRRFPDMVMVPKPPAPLPRCAPRLVQECQRPHGGRGGAAEARLSRPSSPHPHRTSV